MLTRKINNRVLIRNTAFTQTFSSTSQSVNLRIHRRILSPRYRSCNSSEFDESLETTSSLCKSNNKQDQTGKRSSEKRRGGVPNKLRGAFLVLCFRKRARPFSFAVKAARRRQFRVKHAGKHLSEPTFLSIFSFFNFPLFLAPDAGTTTWHFTTQKFPYQRRHAYRRGGSPSSSYSRIPRTIFPSKGWSFELVT